MKKGTVWLVAAAVAASLAVAGCGDDDDESSGSGGSEAETIDIDGEIANYEGTEAAGDSVEFEEDDFYFEPTVLTGEAGQKVTLEITNEGDSEHNLTISGQGIDEDTGPGETATVDAQIPDSGVIAFECSFHAAQGMRGALAVTGSEPEPTAAETTEETTPSSSGGGY